MPTMSNIRVFVQWKEATVFAGETIECTITFKNINSLVNTETLPTSIEKANGFSTKEDRHPQVTPSHPQHASLTSRNLSVALHQPPESIRTHRPALSVFTPGMIDTGRPILHHNLIQNGTQAPRKHGRSLSIMSLGTDTGTETFRDRATTGPPKRSSRGHSRSASLQVLPVRNNGGVSAFSGQRATANASPLLPSPTPTSESQNDFSFPSRPSSRSPGAATVPSTPATVHGAKQTPGSFQHSFKFPSNPFPDNSPAIDSSPEHPSFPQLATPQVGTSAPKPSDDGTTSHDTLSPRTRVLAGTSMNGTPRSSGEFYALSNNSTETLASEYISQPSIRLLPPPGRTRMNQRQSIAQPKSGPEMLMMGFAQVMGSFTLDGSLVNQGPFEEVKRKGVVGGQAGGGVVGVERTKRESGLFGALGWSSLGESLGGIIGVSEPSSIREMRGIASSKSIPLLSTPQSILFVDLRLGPGESKSFKYSFMLPRGLPPSHKGRAIKVSYHIAIGTQRPGFAKTQQITHVSIPFRVFGSVTSNGDILGHDLMSPYIVLRDQAETSTIEDSRHINRIERISSQPLESNQLGPSEFLLYVDKLLEKPNETPNLGLLSPTEPGTRRFSFLDEPRSMREAIDLAILRSNHLTSSNQSANRFEIARSGRSVAVIMIARPAYRLGETIPIVIDFANTDIPCYSVHVSLETSEKVDPAIALRSNASIYRVTRKVHATFSENALFAERLTFSPTIPPNSTPEFITSGVSLEWKLRIEFITPRISPYDDQGRLGNNFLEEISSDDRGVILAAVETLPCESFEVAVPIKVYGSIIGSQEGSEIEGLKV